MTTHRPAEHDSAGGVTAQEDVFSWIEQVFQSGDIESAFEQLMDRFRREKQYWRLFDARLMKKRLELGLPLVSSQPLGDLPKHVQQPYQDAYVKAAREVGELFLADGNIPRAWPYFRAVGDVKPVMEALEKMESTEADTPESQDLLGAAIQIAYQEGVHPRKGFELILKHSGICRAITMFSAYPGQEGRAESLRLLLRTLHSDLVEALKRTIASVEGAAPPSNSVSELIAGRDWLFDNNAQHTDSSHLVSALRLSAELEDKETLKLAVELADYGSRLGDMFQYEDDPPFEHGYTDRGVYLKALLGDEVDSAVQHFEQKVADLDPDQYGSGPAEVLVQLLTRVSRYDDAIKAFRRYLADVETEELSCPSLLQLCQMAGDFEQLKQVAQQQSDPLSYMAGVLQSRTASPKRQY
jgi:hypothetical protein